MIKTTYDIGKVWGIPIRIHISLLVILPIMAYQLQSLIIPVLLFASVALHELGHCYIARKKGAYVPEIVLMMMGGVAKIVNMPKRPADEIKMAVAGPIVSLVLGAIGIGLALEIAVLGPFIRKTLFWIGSINLALGLFNLIPAFPMDGGRILRAALTPKKGRVEATRIAAGIGKFCAVLFGIYGLFNGHFLLVIIAIYIHSAATSEYRMVLIEEGAGPQNPFKNPFFQQPKPPRPSDDLEADVSPPPYAKKEDPLDQTIKRAKNFFGNLFK
jgi:Zn-dependent protease